MLIDIFKFPEKIFLLLCTIMINKEQKPNPQEDQIPKKPFFLDLLIEEPPTMTHKDLQKSTGTSMVWTAKYA